MDNEQAFPIIRQTVLDTTDPRRLAEFYRCGSTPTQPGTRSASSSPTGRSGKAWRRDTTWRSRGKRRLQHEIVVFAQVPADRPAIVDGGRTPTEIEDYVAARWWDVAEITQSQERFYPSRLPELLPRFLAGEEINEPFEFWN